MIIFEHANTNCNWQCPICKINEDKPVVLVKIQGTEKGGNIKAEQIHIDCIDLTIMRLPESSLLIQQYK